MRCSWFAQNFSEDYMAEMVREGEVALPAGDVPEPFVDADDIADVAVAALTEEGHVGQVHELTGPRPLTFAEAVEEIGRAAGRRVDFVPLPIEVFARAMAEQGAPDDVVALMRYLFTEVLDGRNVTPADGVRRALGRAARLPRLRACRGGERRVGGAGGRRAVSPAGPTRRRGARAG